jgi:hypothetical protein
MTIHTQVSAHQRPTEEAGGEMSSTTTGMVLLHSTDYRQNTRKQVTQ